MRTTIDLPDPLFRRTKALAALRGSSMRELIVGAIEREVNSETRAGDRISRRAKLPLFHLREGQKLDLRHFNFDDLLA